MAMLMFSRLLAYGYFDAAARCAAISMTMISEPRVRVSEVYARAAGSGAAMRAMRVLLC